MLAILFRPQCIKQQAIIWSNIGWNPWRQVASVCYNEYLHGGLWFIKRAVGDICHQNYHVHETIFLIICDNELCRFSKSAVW